MEFEADNNGVVIKIDYDYLVKLQKISDCIRRRLSEIDTDYFIVSNDLKDAELVAGHNSYAAGYWHAAKESLESQKIILQMILEGKYEEEKENEESKTEI